MKPLTNEERNAVFTKFYAIFGGRCRNMETAGEEFDNFLRAAGLLEPEEDALAKARRLWVELDRVLARKIPWDENEEKTIEMHDAYEQAVSERDAEIARLKAEASERWATDDNMLYAYDAGKLYYNGGDKIAWLAEAKLWLAMCDNNQANEAEIALLKREAWDDEDMRRCWYGAIGWFTASHTKSDGFRTWLADRKAKKEAGS